VIDLCVYGVQESKRRLLVLYAFRVKQSNDAVECRGCTGSSLVSVVMAIVDDTVIVGLCCNVWKTCKILVAETAR